jgi:formylmethanofuran:tetrahydromethanopterin formyltransferase
MYSSKLDFVLTPDGRPGYVIEMHAKGKSVKVNMIGNCGKPYQVVELVKRLRSISQTEAWKLSIPYDR